MQYFYYCIFFLSCSFAQADDISAAVKSQREQSAKSFVVERNIFSAGASLSATHLQGVLKNSGTVFVRNLSTQAGTLVLVHSPSDRMVLSTPLQSSMTALNMYTPYEGWNIATAAQATDVFKGLLDLVESGCKDISCASIGVEYRCSYTTNFGYSKSAMMTRTGLLR